MILSILLNNSKKRVKPFVRDRQTQSSNDRHTDTEHTDTEETVSHTGTNRHRDRESHKTASKQAHIHTHTVDRQGMEVSGNMKQRIQIWTLSWFSDSKGMCCHFFP